MDEQPQNGELRVWWIPQIPGIPFHAKVPSISAAALLIKTFAQYDQFQLDMGIKPDYANSGGLEVFDGEEWVSWDCDGFDCPIEYLQEQEEEADESFEEVCNAIGLPKPSTGIHIPNATITGEVKMELADPCDSCFHRKNAGVGHCYMFKDRPPMPCAQHELETFEFGIQRHVESTAMSRDMAIYRAYQRIRVVSDGGRHKVKIGEDYLFGNFYELSQAAAIVAQGRIDLALELMGLSADIQYLGGDWRSFVPGGQ